MAVMRIRIHSSFCMSKLLIRSMTVHTLLFSHIAVRRCYLAPLRYDLFHDFLTHSRPGEVRDWVLGCAHAPSEHRKEEKLIFFTLLPTMEKDLAHGINIFHFENLLANFLILRCSPPFFGKLGTRRPNMYWSPKSASNYIQVWQKKVFSEKIKMLKNNSSWDARSYEKVYRLYSKINSYPRQSFHIYRLTYFLTEWYSTKFLAYEKNSGFNLHN